MKSITLTEWFEELQHMCQERTSFCPTYDLGYDKNSFEEEFLAGIDAEDVWDNLCSDMRVRRRFIEGT